MDNETSKEVEDFIVGQQKAALKYTAPDRHCHPAEKAVQRRKATFKSILASLPKNFLLRIGAACYRRTSASISYAPIGRILCCWRGQQWRANCTLMPVQLPCQAQKCYFTRSRQGEAVLVSTPKRRGAWDHALMQGRTFESLGSRHYVRFPVEAAL